MSSKTIAMVLSLSMTVLITAVLVWQLRHPELRYRRMALIYSVVTLFLNLVSAFLNTAIVLR